MINKIVRLQKESFPLRESNYSKQITQQQREISKFDWGEIERVRVQRIKKPTNNHNF